MTAAAWSTALCSAESRSMRAARVAWIVGGTRMWASGRVSW